MARLNLDELDDPLLFDGMVSFAGGMNGFLKPSKLDQTTSELLVNVDPDLAGKLVTRKGTARLGASLGAAKKIDGMCWYDTDTVTLLVVACDGSLHTWNGTSWTTLGSYTYTAGNKVSMVVLAGKLYIGNGSSAETWVYTGTGSPTACVKFGLVGTTINSNMMFTHTFRIFAIAPYGQPSDSVFASPVLFDDATSDNWTAGFSFRIGGDGDPITAAVPWQKFLTIFFKRTKIYVIDTDPSLQTAPFSAGFTPSAATWPIETISSLVGCVAERSVALVGTEVYFLAEDGVRTIGRTIREQEIGIGAPISEPMRPIIERINWSYVQLSSASYFKNRYMLSVPLDASTVPNYTMVYNTITQKWSGYWTGWTPLVFGHTAFGGSSRLVYGNNNGEVFEWLEYKTEDLESADTYEDQGVDIETEALSRECEFNELAAPKTGYSFEVEFYRSKAPQVTIDAVLDGQSSSQEFSGDSAMAAGVILPKTLPFTLSALGRKRVVGDLLRHGQFRGVQLRIKSPSGKLSVQGIVMSAFLDTIKES